MAPEQWQNVEALFAEASELPPEQRREFLDRRCPDPAQLAILEVMRRTTD